MNHGMTSAETLGTIALSLWIAAFVVLLIGIVFAKSPLAESRRMATSTPFALGELGTPGHFREPADPSYIDELIRIRATAPVIYNPAPLVSSMIEIDFPAGPLADRPYSIPLAELVASARYVIPALPVAASSPRSNPYLPGHADRVGRHRAPERALALAAA